MPRALCWCVCTTVGRIFGLFGFKPCFGSSKIGVGIFVCPVWCLNIRDGYGMWRGWIYSYAWAEEGRQKSGICIFPGICDMTRGDMDRDHWRLSLWLCPRWHLAHPQAGGSLGGPAAAWGWQQT